jgi:hypothetical protein
MLRSNKTVERYFIAGKDKAFLELNVSGSIGTYELSQQNQQVIHVFTAKL